MTKLDSESERKLIETAKDLVPGLIEYIVDHAKDLQQRAHCAVSKDEKENEMLSNELFFESLYFILHLLDRIVFQVLGEYKRSIFMDTIFQTISEGLSEGVCSEKDFREGLNKNQTEYSRYKLFHDPTNHILKDVVNWEFAKKIMIQYGDQNPASITVISHGGLLVIKDLQEVLAASTL